MAGLDSSIDSRPGGAFDEQAVGSSDCGTVTGTWLSVTGTLVVSCCSRDANSADGALGVRDFLPNKTGKIPFLSPVVSSLGTLALLGNNNRRSGRSGD